MPLRPGGARFRFRGLAEAAGPAVKRSATPSIRDGVAVHDAPPPEVVSALSKADRLYSPAEVEAAFDSMASAISLVVAERAPLVLAVMTGGLIPAGKLLARLTFPLELDYVHVTRYRGELEGRDVEWRGYPSASIAGRVVLVVDDILDEGFTLAAVIEHCRGEGASAVFSAVLVDKQHERTRRVPEADFTGLRVPDRYVFGSGMDYRGYYRNLPGIYAV